MSSGAGGSCPGGCESLGGLYASKILVVDEAVLHVQVGNLDVATNLSGSIEITNH